MEAICLDTNIIIDMQIESSRDIAINLKCLPFFKNNI
jgi:hypothetical protein